jgi:hypothetical protein
MISSLLAIALATEPVAAMPDNSDVLMCFVKDAKKVYEKGKNEYLLLGLQYDASSPDLKPKVLLHDPHNLFVGSSITKIARVDNGAVFFQAHDSDKGEIALAVQVGSSDTTLLNAGVFNDHVNGQKVDFRVRWLGDCKWGKFKSGSGLMFDSIKSMESTLYRNDDK